MILIIGGICQGKAEYARKLLYGQTDRQADRPADGLENKDVPTAVDGMQNRWEEVPGKSCVLNFHGFVRQVLEAGLEPDDFVRQVLKNPPEVVTLDEVGSGIVPLKRSDRDYREAAGRAGQLLAAEAQQVYRMVCGIPVRIK